MWLTARSELRMQLSDGATDRLRYRQQVFGELNGTNVRYKTFEFRRITNFTREEGVWLNGNILPISAVAQDVLQTGEFFLNEAPEDGDVLEASFYVQWFLDPELDAILMEAAQWTISINDITGITEGLRPCALSYACSRAYLKMAQRWRDPMSATYKVEDAKAKPGSGPVAEFIAMAKTFREEAEAMRKEFYKRQDQPLQPLFGIAVGAVRQMP